MLLIANFGRRIIVTSNEEKNKKRYKINKKIVKYMEIQTKSINFAFK